MIDKLKSYEIHMAAATKSYNTTRTISQSNRKRIIKGKDCNNMYFKHCKDHGSCFFFMHDSK